MAWPNGGMTEVGQKEVRPLLLRGQTELTEETLAPLGSTGQDPWLTMSPPEVGSPLDIPMKETCLLKGTVRLAESSPPCSGMA